MSRLKDLMIDVQADIEHVKSLKAGFTKDEVVSFVLLGKRVEDKDTPVTRTFVEEVYDLTVGGGHCDPNAQYFI